ncbi:MAG: 2-phospho-L-lactate guanylyltransferase [Dehalococcoidia bacterium]
MRFALIPVKELPRAKARLAPLLDDGGRRELVVALFRDVLEAAIACPALDGVAAVTRDAGVLAMAAEAGTEALPEPGATTGSGPGLNEALTTAARAMAERGVDRIIVLAADLPLVTPGDIAAVARSDADVVIVPSLDGGTNALALTPNAIDFGFGPQSEQRHLDAAEAAGLSTQRLDLPALALDIDTPDDLERLWAAVEEGRPAGRHTLEALERLGLIAAADPAVKPPVRGG